MKASRVIILAVVAALVYVIWAYDLLQYLSLEQLKAQQAALSDYTAANPLKAALIFAGIYIVSTALSLPGAAILTLCGGAIFGLLLGTIIVSFASTIGATLAFLVSRLLLRDVVQQKFGKNLKAINEGVERDGAFYLFTMRLVPAFPFFAINLLMGLTPIKTITYFFVSQLGMLAGTIVYVNAGTELAKLESAGDILSPGLLFSFVLLGIFPLIAKKIVDTIKAGKIYKPYAKPKQFDRNIIVIGAGAAGLVTSYIAAAVKSKVTLIEKHKMGGDCLNTGCVPSKALIRTAKLVHQAKHSETYGLASMQVEMDFAQVMERVQRVVQQIEPHDSVERYTDLGVECIQGQAKITSPYTVEVNGQTLSAQNLVVATGARPFVPPIPGIEEVGYLTSDTVWELREQPKRLIVLGGGPIGSELTQAFARLGSQVTQVEMADRIMVREDPEVSRFVMDKFAAEGISVKVGHKAKQFVLEQGEKILICEHQGQDVRIPFDQVLVAVGRRANVTGFGLEELGISIAPSGTIEVNDYLQTRYPNIYACGDVSGPYQFTHTAAHQAWYAAVNPLFGMLKKFKADYSVIPWATFTDPEVARVGFNEQEATEQGIAYEVVTYGIDDLDRAIADDAAHGFVKVLTVPGSKQGKILGVTIVGEHAGDIIAEYVAAMKQGFGLNQILGTIHIYPTLAEANKYAAGVWKQKNAPEGLLNLVKRFHAWRRGESPWQQQS